VDRPATSLFAGCSLCPSRLYVAGSAEPAGSTKQTPALRAVDGMCRQRLAASCRRPRPSWCHHWLYSHPAHMGSNSNAPSPCALPGAGRRSVARCQPVDTGPARILPSGSSPSAVVPRAVWNSNNNWYRFYAALFLFWFLILISASKGVL